MRFGHVGTTLRKLIRPQGGSFRGVPARACRSSGGGRNGAHAGSGRAQAGDAKQGADGATAGGAGKLPFLVVLYALLFSSRLMLSFGFGAIIREAGW